MKKKALLLIPILFLICFSSSTAKAITTEQSGGVDGLGLFDYSQRFDDLSGALLVTTTSVNNSGMNEVFIIVSVICMNESRNFRLRIYDSDVKTFIEVHNEDGIGAKTRKFSVRVHMDSENIMWSAFATDMSGEIVYAKISLFYLYDEDAGWTPPGEEEEQGISQEEHEKELKIASRNTSLSYLAIIFVTIFLTGAVVIQRKGTGIKHFIKSKIKSEGD